MAKKFAENYAAFQIWFADAVEFLPHGLAGIQGNAVVGTPLVNALVEFVRQTGQLSRHNVHGQCKGSAWHQRGLVGQTCHHCRGYCRDWYNDEAHDRVAWHSQSCFGWNLHTPIQTRAPQGRAWHPICGIRDTQWFYHRLWSRLRPAGSWFEGHLCLEELKK